MDWKEEIQDLVKNGMNTYKATDKIKEKYKLTENYETIRYYARKAKKPATEKADHSTGVTSTAHGEIRQKIIEVNPGDEITPDFLLDAFGLSKKQWKIKTYKYNFWDTQEKGGSTLTLYQATINVEPMQEDLNVYNILEHFSNLTPKSLDIKSKCESGDKIAVVNIADLHLGKLAWHGDCGENYDHHIAKKIFNQITLDIYQYLEHKSLEKIYLVWTNDYFNSDTINKETTGNTPQDTDVRWQKLFNVGCELLVAAIDTLRMIAPVYTFYTPSNHDKMAAYYGICYLSAWYKDTNNVTVEIDAYPRKYVSYGKVLLGFCHGDKERSNGSKEKASRLASLMPIEARDKWGKTKYAEFQTAHLHSEQMIQEINGVIVRRISSPTYLDTWHVENGYLGTVKKAQTFIYDKARGLIDIHNTPVEEDN